MTEAARKVDFSMVRYAQLWEDADVLLDALDVQPGDTCLSIASAGDNALALLTRDPARVLAVDLNPAQLRCVRLRIAAYGTLEHGEYLELFGSTQSSRRAELLARCRRELSPDDAAFFDSLAPQIIRYGIGGIGKFERYFRNFRRWVMPLVHGRRKIESLFTPRSGSEREAFYRELWNTRRWRMVFSLFFSRRVMGRLGRDAAMFDYVDVPVSERIFRRAEHALATLDPAENPYLQWILLGRHPFALPVASRLENYDIIRSRLDRLELRHASVEEVLDDYRGQPIVRFNLSDIFEYMSADNAASLLRRIAHCSSPGGRLAYWNMLVPRSRPPSLADRLVPLEDIAAQLHERDKAFFYMRLVVESVQ